MVRSYKKRKRRNEEKGGDKSYSEDRRALLSEPIALIYVTSGPGIFVLCAESIPNICLLAKGPRRNHAAHQPVGLGVGLCKLCLSA